MGFFTVKLPAVTATDYSNSNSGKRKKRRRKRRKKRSNT